MFNEEKEGLDWCTEFSKEELDKIRNTKKGRIEDENQDKITFMFNY